MCSFQSTCASVHEEVKRRNSRRLYIMLMFAKKKADEDRPGVTAQNCWNLCENTIGKSRMAFHTVWSIIKIKSAQCEEIFPDFFFLLVVFHWIFLGAAPSWYNCRNVHTWRRSRGEVSLLVAEELKVLKVFLLERLDIFWPNLTSSDHLTRYMDLTQVPLVTWLLGSPTFHHSPTPPPYQKWFTNFS